MHPLVQDRLDELRRLCQTHKVRRLELFGSATSDDFDPESSDLDFAVQFDPLPPGTRADTYFDLLEGLTELFGRPVDLIMDSAVRNPYFRQQLEETKVPVYASGG